MDDNRDGADSLAMMLEIMGNEAHTAYDGEDAVAAVKDFRPNVILLDIGLPKLNGYEVCRRIREGQGGTGFVIIAQTRWGRGRRNLALCIYPKRGNPGRITLSIYYVNLNSEEVVRDSILHEIAHSVCPGDGHGNLWRAKCKELGCKPERLNREFIRVPGRYQAKCPTCQQTLHRYRKPSFPAYFCASCGPNSLVTFKKYRWSPNEKEESHLTHLSKMTSLLHPQPGEAMSKILAFAVTLSGMCFCATSSADDAEDKSVAFVEKLGGKVIRDEKTPGKPVIIVQLSSKNNKLTEESLKVLAALKNPPKLDIWNSPITDAGLKELAPLKNLTSLYIGNTNVSDAGLKELAVLKKLTSLDLMGTKVTDTGLKEVAKLQNLTTLILFDTSVTDQGLKEVAKLKNLTSLNLTATKISDAGLAELTVLQNLTSLDVSLTPIADAGIKKLAKLQTLTTLNLCRTQVTDEGMKELIGLQNLTSINLSSTQVSDEGLKHLAVLKNLTSLEIGITKVSDEGMKLLTSLENLTSLSLCNANVSDEGLKELAKLQNLTSLNILNTKVTDIGMKELAKLKNLTTLELFQTSVTDNGLKELAKLTNLTSLNLRFTKVTAAGIKELQQALPKCKILG